jgi:hypothetical protein
MRPMELFPGLVNHSAPSGSAVIPSGLLLLLLLVPVKSVTLGCVVIRLIELSP